MTLNQGGESRGERQSVGVGVRLSGACVRIMKIEMKIEMKTEMGIIIMVPSNWGIKVEERK